ncbi:MAG TPA: DUF3168 domain-containing protein [Pirellulales bacterium]|jgi:hypothetical protein
MNGPDYELQVAAVTALLADAALTALIGTRLYQNVPANPAFPYVTIGESQNVPDDAECIDGSEIFLTLHVWTRQNGIDFGPNKKIVAALDAVLNNAVLTLAGGYRCVEIKRDGARFFVDPDNVTVHGVASYRAMVDPTD